LPEGLAEFNHQLSSIKKQMRKNVFGRQLKRDKNERSALFKGLITSLVLNESIKTTEAKAKAIKGEVEKLVTRAQKEKNLATRLLSKRLSPIAIEKMINEIGPRFAKRNGGYTRIVRLGKRFGDDAQVVLLEWVEKAQVKAVVEKPVKKEVKTEKVPAKKVEKPKAKPVAKKPIKKASK
jgi:large subunit ribosomal protein L17